MFKEVTVWSLPNCVNCARTELWLENHNIEYYLEDLTDPINSEVLQYFKNNGLTAAPIVEVYDVLEYGIDDTEALDTWSGYNENKLEEHFA